MKHKYKYFYVDHQEAIVIFKNSREIATVCIRDGELRLIMRQEYKGLDWIPWTLDIIEEDAYESWNAFPVKHAQNYPVSLIVKLKKMGVEFCESQGMGAEKNA